MSYQKFFFLYVKTLYYIIRKVVMFYFQICVTHVSRVTVYKD